MNTKSRGYAGMDTSGKLSPWEFERRPVGENDILIDIKFASICHSDIHTIMGDWGPQQYPQVPGHEIVGIVAAVGKQVTKFKIGDRAGVGCMVNSCLQCDSCDHGEEHHCDNGATVWTYGNPEVSSPTGITQGGYSNNIVVHEHFAVHIPEHISLEKSAPLLCAGITTYSPLMQHKIKAGDKVGVAGIGGLGHMAIKLAVAMGAEVYAFTSNASKVADIEALGVKEVVVVDKLSRLRPYKKTLDYLISTIPVAFNVGAYASVVKPYGYFTQVGMPVGSSMKLNLVELAFARIHFNASIIGGIAETQDLVNFCADNGIIPDTELISAQQINDAWEKLINNTAGHQRFVIDAATF
jgi:alcohol dehydrogenase (NADP+)